MKLVTFRRDGEAPEIGVLNKAESAIAALQAGQMARAGQSDENFADMLSLLRGGQAAMGQAEVVADYIFDQQPADALVSLDAVTLLSPLPRPESLRDCMAFEDHIINATRRVGLGPFAAVDDAIERIFGRRWSLARAANKAWYERPVYYKSNRFSVVGHDAQVRIPSYAQNLDYELEWGIVIGTAGRDIAAKDAGGHIAGYTIFNDFSARAIQLAEMKGRLGPAKGKDFDTGNAIGPCLVTPDEIPDPYALAMTARVNGAEWSRGSSGDMYWSFEEIIAYISQSETLYPGEFIGSGTCSGPLGKGCGLELGRSLTAGDEIVLAVEKIGELRNRIVSEAHAPSDGTL